MEHLPIYVPVVFILVVLMAIATIYKASNRSGTFLMIITIWVIIQTILSLSGFYTITLSRPPRAAFLVLPPMIFIIALFNIKSGKQFMDKMDIRTLTIFHTLRIIVELVLFWLYTHKAVPGLMTFEGRNFDILSGLTAPVIYYFSFVKKTIGRRALITWNIICLGLLLNIIIIGLLSAPGNMQRLAFDQPNIAIQHFPFVLLPSLLVPLVLFSHLVTIRQLSKV